MAISSYSELLTAIASWTHRADLSGVLPDFVTLGESRIYNGSADPQFPSKPLRLMNMQNRATGTVGTLGAIAIPTGFLEVIRFNLSVSSVNRPLQYRAPIDNGLFETQQGRGNYYTIVNNSFYVAPYDSSSYSLDYYKKFDALTTTATNWLLINAPQVYLYASLIETAPYLNKDSRIPTWHRLFSAAINGLQNSDRRAGYGQALAVVAG